jgi:L-Ala-D/L-Glu epimerase
MTMHRPTRMNLRVEAEKWQLKTPFRITGRTTVDVDVIVVTLKQRGFLGRGEAAGIFYRGEDVASMMGRIEAARTCIEAGIDCQSLQSLLPPLSAGGVA